MEEKAWYLSRGAVANVLGTVLSVAVALGFIEIDGETRNAILAQGPDLWVGLVGTVVNLVGLWGRIKANTRLRWPLLGSS